MGDSLRLKPEYYLGSEKSPLQMSLSGNLKTTQGKGGWLMLPAGESRGCWVHPTTPLSPSAPPKHLLHGGGKRMGVRTWGDGRIVGLPCLWSQLHRRLCFSAAADSKGKLFVGGLSWSVDEKSLRDAFSSFGPVLEVKILYDKDSGRSRGFGFVSFSSQADAQCAKDAMDGKALMGRPLRISYALVKVRGVPVVVPRLS
ncbi:hypothetical protein MLD38_018160 [Melastoma candidum]|uniref:Uncharacterized protein n=1 Tax=Melastoma candidum TaxID=119954 RepID=A0ACB9QSD9_9MYRT|nr:hypothetical protein MLD38_018160 [Melastoma candidum]